MKKALNQLELVSFVGAIKDYFRSLQRDAEYKRAKYLIVGGDKDALEIAECHVKRELDKIYELAPERRPLLYCFEVHNINDIVGHNFIDISLDDLKILFGDGKFYSRIYFRWGGNPTEVSKFDKLKNFFIDTNFNAANKSISNRADKENLIVEVETWNEIDHRTMVVEFNIEDTSEDW